MNLCIDCGEETLNAERCRDCDIEHAIEGQMCFGCGWWCSLLSPGAKGPGAHGKSPTCCPVMAL